MPQPDVVIAIVDDDPSAREGLSTTMGERASHWLLPCSSAPCTALMVMLGICLCYLLLAADSAHALDPNKRITQYLHTSWRIQDGSLPSSMSSIAQTSDGFLWFSSLSQGIYRFDGVRFLPWSIAGKGASINTTAVVLGEGEGGLWIVTERDIVHLNNGAVTSRFESEGDQSPRVSMGPDGSLWFARTSNATTAPLCHVSDRAIRCFGKADGIPISPIDSLLPDGKGGFWLGGQTTLVHWHNGMSDLYPIEALKSNIGQHGIDTLALGPDGSLWVGILAEGPGLGLCRLIEGTVKPFRTRTFDGSKVVVDDLSFDADGNLWVATAGKGIFRIRGNVVDHYGQAEGLSGDTVFTVFEDRERIVWVATTNGLDSLRDPRITTFSALEGLGKDAAAGVLASKDGTVWVANAESLDRIKNGAVSSIRTGSGLPGHQVTYLMEDRARNLWVGVDDGLYLFKEGRFHRIPEPKHQPLGMVIGLTEDTDGNVWAQCIGNPRKLVRIRDFQVREQFPAPQFPPGRVITADPHGGIWIATLNKELALFRNGALQKFSLQPNSSPARHQIVAEADGSVLAASENGLIGLRQGKVRRMTTENGLPCDFVISFIQDQEKRWWFYTQCGVVELPDSELEKWWANSEAMVQTRLYDVLDGARPNAPSFTSAAYSPDGRVWFANGVVVQMLDPSGLSQRALPAATYIESVIAERKEYHANENLRLPPHPRDLQIDYTSPTFLIPQRVKFRYRLDPYDRDWHDAGTRRQAFYTDLPPGKYSFHVMAANSDGVWNETAAKLDFSIAPAYYQTNWFRALCGAAFLALLWAAYQLRLRHLHREFKRAEEQREKLRQLEADLAHINRVSMMGELTASIAHEVNQPLSGVVSNASACLRWLAGDAPNLEEAREAARRIVRDGKRAAEVISRIRAMTRKAEAAREKLDLNETIRDVLALVGDEAKKNRVAIRTEFADDVSPVLGDRVQLQQVMLNLVMNGIEAMSIVGEQARELAVITRNTDSDQVQVTVQDSGVGLDPDTMPKIFDPFYTTKPSGMGMGLSITRSILQAHGGQLWAAANDGPGTSFHFTLPRREEGSHAAA
ncbi:MAG TPA: ATP-binding protein [Terriglobales bacterium]|nr:ATP-binding protein [Terriglobales bacterium]